MSWHRIALEGIGLAWGQPLQCRLQNYKMFVNQQRKLRKNLEGTGKMLIFAASNLKFGYPGRIPRGQDYIDTTQIKESP